jgi:hypothetical protein
MALELETLHVYDLSTALRIHLASSLDSLTNLE